MGSIASGPGGTTQSRLPLITSTFALILRSLRPLADNERRALVLQITPQKTPKVVIGANTVRTENGKTVIENAQLPGVAERGPIALQHHGDPIQCANIYVRELE